MSENLKINDLSYLVLLDFMAHRKKGGGAWKESVKHSVAVPSLPIIGHALRNDLQTGPR